MECAKALRLESAGNDENMSLAVRGPPPPRPGQLLQCLRGPSWVVHVARFENQSTDSQSVYCMAQKADTGKLCFFKNKKNLNQ